MISKIKKLITAIGLAITVCLTLVFVSLPNFGYAKVFNHGYIGKAQFDINSKDFALKNKSGTCKYLFADGHFHPRDFIMQGSSLQEIAKETSQNCVDKILVNSLPLINHWSDETETRPSYYTDDKSKFYWNSISDIPTFNEYKSLPKQDKEKFYFLINGFLHFDRGAKEAVLNTIESYKELPIVGFGEVFGDHDIMSDQMNPPSKINSKALDEIYQLAAEKHWFVLFHNNIANRSFKGSTQPIYLPKIKEILNKHQNTTFIWAHSGIMRNIVVEDLTAIVQQMLNEHSNLYIDISFVLLENYIMAEGTPSKKWVELISKNPDRFIFGTDDLGSYKDFADVKKYLPLLDNLKPEVANKVASGNLKKLIDIAVSTNISKKSS